MARSARHFLARRTMRMTMSRASSGSRLARLTLSVRWRRISKESNLWILFPNAGTAGIIEKIRKTVGDKPVYLSIDVRRLFVYRTNMLTQRCGARSIFFTGCRSIRSTLRSHPRQAHPRLAVGRRASCAPSCEAWTACILSRPILLRLPLRMIRTRSSRPWPLRM